MRGFGMNKNNPPNTFANRFWHSDTCLDVEMNKSKYFMEYIPKYYAESRKTPEDILHFICIHFPDLFNIFHPIDLFSLWCAGLCGLGGAGQMRCLMCDPVTTPDWCWRGPSAIARPGSGNTVTTLQLLMASSRWPLLLVFHLPTVICDPAPSQHQPPRHQGCLCLQGEICLLFNIN